jgi:hypothetical protein
VLAAYSHAIIQVADPTGRGVSTVTTDHNTQARLKSGASGCLNLLGVSAKRQTLGAVFIAIAISVISFSSFLDRATAQPASGDEAAKRLEQEKEGKNKYRGGSENFETVKRDMKEKLFPKIMASSESDSKADEWYSPHLRDSKMFPSTKKEEAFYRGNTTPPNVYLCILSHLGLIPWWVPPDDFTACPLGACGRPGVWHGEPYKFHRPIEACYTAPTTIYKTFTQDSNFKICCVRKGEERATTEQIAAWHPDGSGWAGLFEYYYPTAAIGWENDRSTTMIVGKDERENPEMCREESDELMENENAVNWVAGAIERNRRQADKISGGGSSGGSGDDVRGLVSDVIKDVRPKDKELRFTDSLQSEGLTMRPNYATMEEEYRRMLARRFCMREEQFLKLMDPQHDTLQLGGGSSVDDLKALPVWSNYCPKGVNLMTNTDKSALENVDGTPTDFTLGMEVWQKDPQFCQRMQLDHPGLQELGFKEVIEESGKGDEQYTMENVGYTCLTGMDAAGMSKLNGSLIPVTLNRYAAVERRTAISKMLGFLIAGGLAEGMREDGTGKYLRSYYKRFEPRPYSKKLPFENQVFVGQQFKGGGFNELLRPCENLSGRDYSGAGDVSDQLYISDYTHRAFTEDKIRHGEAASGGSFNLNGEPEPPGQGVNRKSQEWAKPGLEKEIANRGLDEKSSNYAAAFRLFATCPKGYVRWRSQEVEHPQMEVELRMFCREENFGGPSRAPGF